MMYSNRISTQTDLIFRGSKYVRNYKAVPCSYFMYVRYSATYVLSLWSGCFDDAMFGLKRQVLDYLADLIGLSAYPIYYPIGC